jgi:adenylate cyclase class 2
MNKIINVEIKAKCLDPDRIHEYIMSHGGDYKGVDHQIDTYFNCENGRLKLRKGNIENSLIFYQRENKAGSRESKIELEILPAVNNMRALLTKANGVKVEVDKHRKIYFIDNVKFHIDQVAGLGSFMEIEAIDTVGKYGVDELTIQCNHYMKELEIKANDLVEISYSDLLNENFEQKLEREARLFGRNLLSDILEKGIDLSPFFMDHLCYRVSTQTDYENFKDEFSKISDLLIESIIGGRQISTYKLHKPIIINNRKLELIELPAPKVGSNYLTGFEHGEFVIPMEFTQLIEMYPTIEFDTKATQKSHNPELRMMLGAGVSAKFHHKSLEEVIKLEKLEL